MKLKAENIKKLLPNLDTEPKEHMQCPQCANMHFLHKTEDIIICVYCRWQGNIYNLK